MVLSVAIVAVVTSGTAGCLASRRPRLVVEDVTRERLLYRGPVAPGSLLVLSYVHSS